ncbi:ribonuclease 1-like [Phragmites australis]|uniref:ribonuclease 1-like n=1 Tax=Phragmites australis TaxID=29695 RepID=UPI002D76854F|nr:ribonuclease 1-like [Phragmites australis]
MAKLVFFLALLLSHLAVSSTAEKFDFFYLVQQWPGSFCDTRQGCCFPDTGKPAADFGIHGLWPNYAKCRGRMGGVARAVLGDDAFFSIVGRRGSKCWPEYCSNGNPLSPWEIRDLMTSLDRNWPTLSCKSGRSLEFWSYEWKKHGTCSNLDQHEYFEAALALKARHNLTSILVGAGIVPSDTRTYFLSSVRDAIAEGTGFKANLECNRDADGEAQLFQVYQCVDRQGEELIDCPLSMPSKCTDRVKLPVF